MKKRTPSKISKTDFSSDLTAIKGIPSLYISCLRFLYLTVGFTTMEGTLFLCIILLFFYLFKFCLVAEKQGVFFCLNVVWLSIKQDEKNWMFISFVWVIFQLSSIGWSPVGWLPRKHRREMGIFYCIFIFWVFEVLFATSDFWFFFFFFFFGRKKNKVS